MVKATSGSSAPLSVLMSRRTFLAGFAAYGLFPEQIYAGTEKKPAEAVVEKRSHLLRDVRLVLGRPYRWGAAGPGAFDCSGLVVWLYARVGMRLPRQALAQGRGGMHVRDHLLTGDVLLFRSAASPSGWHTGLYVGKGVYVHAPGRGKSVCLSSLRNSFSRRNFVTARRYLV